MFSRIATLLFLVPSVAWGFTFLLEGIKGWEKKEIRLYLNPADCSIPAGEIEEAIQRGIKAWNRVPSADVILRYEGQTTQTGTQDDPVVECATSGLSEALGVTRVSTMNGRIFTGYIQLNSDPASEANILNYRGDRLAIVVAHEMGHVLGLGHAATEEALMYFSIGRKENLVLAQDDIDGVSYLYPRREPDDGLLGCGSLAAPGAGGGGSGGGLLGVLAFLGLVSLWLKRRPAPCFELHLA